VRALQKVGGADRIASVWYSTNAFNIDFAFNDANSHQVAIYAMDWDNSGRSERFEVIDPSNNTVLNTVDLTDFSQGKYLIWNLHGNTRIRVTRTSGINAVIEGIFFDAPAHPWTGSLRVLGASPSGVQLQITGDTGVVYNIQSSIDMKTWTNVGQLPMTASPLTYTDTTVSGQQGVRFYRVAP
jgi:hypothetical protein